MDAEQKKIKLQERRFGRKAAEMAQDYVHTVIRQKVQIRGKGGKKEKPLLYSTRVNAKMGDYRLMGLNLTSSRIGFILHEGFIGVREATKVHFSNDRFKKSYTQRKRHHVNLPMEDFFSDMYKESGALDFLIEMLSETRTEAFQLKLNGMIYEFNKQSENGE